MPTPALLPGIIGMGIAALKKRRDGELAEAEAEAEA
ncbi:PTPA-CTERM sorting domain-containing protein [Thermoleptolyngbya sp.]